ncbi:MAG TPA: histidine kinase dimerization/phosphoacceptor domain -containing protein, partial [Cyanophyceae cyanobacterium]
RTAEGAVQQIIGTAEDISDRKRAEEQIRASLAEKEVLLREIHHRVKNNLNVIHSLLNMQVRTIQDPVTKNLLLDSQKRLQTMALIHEQLYQSQSLAEINFAEYIHRLANNLFAAANLNHDLIKLQIQAEPVDLNLETAIPCGLIINELLTNSFKHAFPEGHSGVIRIEFYRDRDETLHLIISDNGVGMPPESNLYKKASLGMRLVKIIVQQLRATLEISGHQGASFHLSFIQIN